MDGHVTCAFLESVRRHELNHRVQQGVIEESPPITPPSQACPVFPKNTSLNFPIMISSPLCNTA